MQQGARATGPVGGAEAHIWSWPLLNLDEGAFVCLLPLHQLAPGGAILVGPLGAHAALLLSCPGPISVCVFPAGCTGILDYCS